MTLTLAENPALSPELATQALTKCKDFFLGLTFSGEGEHIKHQKSLQDALKNGSGVLTFETSKYNLIGAPVTCVFFINVGMKEQIFEPDYSDLGYRFKLQLAKILTDDEISSLFLYGAKINERYYEKKLLGHISKLDLQTVFGGVTNESIATRNFDDAKEHLAEISRSTVEQVRQFLIASK